MFTALITGGTSGIGAAFAKALARRGLNLVLVARDETRLQEVAAGLRDRYRIEVETIAADLGDQEEVARVATRIEHPDHPVDILINNAGFSVKGAISAPDHRLHDAGFDVMCRAVMVLSSAAARAMTPRGRGWILNVSSVAGEVAMGPYSAIKSWTTTFTESLAVELRGTGVHVTALLPGWVRTEFHSRAGISGSSIPSWLWLDADKLVEEALKDVSRGKTLSIPTLRYKALMCVVKYAPRSGIRLASGWLNGARAREKAQP
ncbi:SDR family NAD(P)-dependent oxidoreductase [Kocuria coralli]|uniref:SDR family NAD(P)-dependent oxidoreductase n=1 Tax=Kocuria coralli TaxID=1461025 RepID=A0A5J5KYJ4_9MICC|nr:SDR family NAD(P)-dependent oxidoreductase [Kocuria coralli]KAA9394743.1 SDR family NAD(P)-dependent oxidoreductase [Kocuria coralli]